MDQTEYRRYQLMLPVMKHRLDDELELHPQVYEIISSRVVILNSRTLEAKNALALVEDELAETIREDHEKITKDAVESKVRGHRLRKQAWQVYQAARAEHEQWAGLLDAWRQKGYSIKTLAELYSADYYSITTRSAGNRSPDYEGERSRQPAPPSAVRDDQSERRSEIRRSINQSSRDAPSEERPARRRTQIDG